MRGVTRVFQAFLLLAASSSWSQSGGPYEIRRSSIDAGGSTSNGGAYSITGSQGQADASLQTAAGGVVSITGGFWSNAVISPAADRVFADGFESD